MSRYITDSKLAPTLKAWMQATLSPGKIAQLAYEPLFNKNRQSRVPQILDCYDDELIKLALIYADELVDYTATHKNLTTSIKNALDRHALDQHHYSGEARLFAKLGFEISISALQHRDDQVTVVSHLMGEYAREQVKTLPPDLTAHIEDFYKNSLNQWEEVA